MQKPLDKISQQILQFITDECRTDGFAYLGYYDIYLHLNKTQEVSDKTVIRKVKKMTDLGLLSVETYAGKKSKYTVSTQDNFVSTQDKNECPPRTLVHPGHESENGVIGGTIGGNVVSYNASNTEEPNNASHIEEQHTQQEYIKPLTKKRAKKNPEMFGHATAYNAEFYRGQITASVIEAAKARLEFPEGMSAAVFLLGAYMIQAKAQRGVDLVIQAGPDFKRFVAGMNQALKHFNALNSGDEVAGFNETLEFVKWYLKLPEDSWEGKQGWPPELMLMAKTYRNYRARRDNEGKQGGYLNRNNTGVMLITDEDRIKANAELKVERS